MEIKFNKTIRTKQNITIKIDNDQIDISDFDNIHSESKLSNEDIEKLMKKYNTSIRFDDEFETYTQPKIIGDKKTKDKIYKEIINRPTPLYKVSIKVSGYGSNMKYTTGSFSGSGEVFLYPNIVEDYLKTHNIKDKDYYLSLKDVKNILCEYFNAPVDEIFENNICDNEPGNEWEMVDWLRTIKGVEYDIFSSDNKYPAFDFNWSIDLDIYN